MRSIETFVSPDIVLTDLSNNQYFYNQYMNSVRNNALLLQFYKSEASILAHEHIKWDGSVYWLDNGELYYNEIYMLKDLYNGNTYASIDSENYNAESRAEYELAAIREQLNNFRASQLYLDSAEGLMYFIRDSSGNTIMSSEIETPYAATLGISPFTTLWIQASRPRLRTP